MGSLRRTAVLPLAAAAALALGACGSSGGASSSSTPAPTADVGEASAVTPVDDATLEAAYEEGEVLMYTNAEDQQIAPVKEAFEAAHAEITLRSLALSDQQMFQRYETEVATGTPTADLVMSNDALGWLEFIEAGNIEPYEDPNDPNLPDYAKLGPGVYAISEDPVIALFNKALLPEDRQPTTVAELAAMAEELDGKIGTTDISTAVSFGATSAYVDKYGEEGWANLEEIGGARQRRGRQRPAGDQAGPGPVRRGVLRRRSGPGLHRRRRGEGRQLPLPGGRHPAPAPGAWASPPMRRTRTPPRSSSTGCSRSRGRRRRARAASRPTATAYGATSGSRRSRPPSAVRTTSTSAPSTRRSRTTRRRSGTAGTRPSVDDHGGHPRGRRARPRTAPDASTAPVAAGHGRRPLPRLGAGRPRARRPRSGRRRRLALVDAALRVGRPPHAGQPPRPPDRPGVVAGRRQQPPLRDHGDDLVGPPRRHRRGPADPDQPAVPPAAHRRLRAPRAAPRPGADRRLDGHLGAGRLRHLLAGAQHRPVLPDRPVQPQRDGAGRDQRRSAHRVPALPHDGAVDRLQPRGRRPQLGCRPGPRAVLRDRAAAPPGDHQLDPPGVRRDLRGARPPADPGVLQEHHPRLDLPLRPLGQRDRRRAGTRLRRCAVPARVRRRPAGRPQPGGRRHRALRDRHGEGEREAAGRPRSVALAAGRTGVVRPPRPRGRAAVRGRGVVGDDDLLAAHLALVGAHHRQLHRRARQPRVGGLRGQQPP
ncbi:extracellular solute-binding protein [Nocardioides sp. TF02-7]|uniref:extracellular solute-binding protein n=1 Tax=Nocardioides sp. TF02-7 TaxID=2917724 RepID=UPI001F054CDC|nr:extracellular solute-binding protein [Nocardioides sp. TF02-7]UMG94083.1 extracellular solute-binding protein [Nocardioides sp. TF02-7]